MNLSFEKLYIRHLVNAAKTTLIFDKIARSKNVNIIEKALHIFSKEIDKKLIVEKHQYGYALQVTFKIQDNSCTIHDFNKINQMNTIDFENFLSEIVQKLYL